MRKLFWASKPMSAACAGVHPSGPVAGPGHQKTAAGSVVVLSKCQAAASGATGGGPAVNLVCEELL